MKAIQITQFGGPEALRETDVPVPDPGPGQALVRVRAAGINFIDVYQRTGRYPVSLPFTPGVEGTGVVERFGPDTAVPDGLRPGGRVAWVLTPGSFAQFALLPADRLVAVPDGLDDTSAAAVLLQGMTAHYLTHATFPLEPGQAALVLAAAGGTGLLLTQLARRRGARVLAVVSTEEKARLAREAGADEIILSSGDLVAEVRRLTGDQGVHVVYDSVGKDTFHQSLRCLRPRGTLVLFGASSGAVPPFDPAELDRHGSLYLTRPSLRHYVADRAALVERAGAVLGAVTRGELRLRVSRVYPWAEVVRVYQDLESRATTGKLVLTIDPA